MKGFVEDYEEKIEKFEIEFEEEWSKLVLKIRRIEFINMEIEILC